MAEYNELHAMQDQRNYDWPEGFGAAFVEFAETYEAIAARKSIHLLKYGQETKKTKAEFVECSYLTETQYKTNDFARDRMHYINELAFVFSNFGPVTQAEALAE